MSTTMGTSPAARRLAEAVAGRVAAGEVKLPLLPRIAHQVLATANDARGDAGTLAVLIHRDPALAGQVLRVANSAAYAPRMPIVSLQQAVARLGTGTITEIAFAVSLQSGTFRVPGREAELQRLWQGAVAAGIWGKELARARRANVESAFLCGLLHGIGKPAILQLLVDLAGEDHGAIDEVIAEVTARHHGEVGIRIGERWELPKPVQAAIKFHADYRSADAFRQEAMSTCLAAHLAGWTIGRAAPSDDEPRLRALDVVADLNLYPDDMTALLAKRNAVRSAVDALCA